MRRIYNLLRSRKLAFWLIAAFIAYATAATIVTEADFERAYSNAFFFAIAGALALATAACAWERTERAARMWSVGFGVTPEFVNRLETSPQIAVPLAPDADPDAALATVAKGLRGLRLRVRSGSARAAGSSGRISLVGSPLFHWCLVLVFVLVAGGRLARSEGLMGVPVGSGVADNVSSYGTLTEGPFHDADFSGLTIKVSDLHLDYTVGGINRGAAPVVELYDGEQLVASRLVYPNSPLRYGSMMVHSDAYGLAAAFTLEGVDDTQSTTVLYDFSEEVPAALNSAPLVFDGGSWTVTIASRVPLDLKGGVAPWVLPAEPRVDWTIDRAGQETTGTARVGDTIALVDGAGLRLDGLTYYARISVVDDWSVYPLYVAFLLAVVGLGLALLLPPKAVWVMLVEREGQLALHARTRQARGDRIFARTVEEVLRKAAKGKDDRS